MQKSLFDELNSHAKAVFTDSKILADTALTQAIHESGFANGPGSLLARKYNNLFGIKGSGDKGSVQLKTGEHLKGKDVTVTDGFAVYSSYRASFEYLRRLYSRPRYKRIFGAMSVEDACLILQRSGYATDPRYAAKLIKTFTFYVKNKS